MLYWLSELGVHVHLHATIFENLGVNVHVHATICKEKSFPCPNHGFKKAVSTSTPGFSMNQVQSERSKGVEVDGRAKLDAPSKSRRSWAKLDGLLRQSER